MSELILKPAGAPPEIFPTVVYHNPVSQSSTRTTTALNVLAKSSIWSSDGIGAIASFSSIHVVIFKEVFNIIEIKFKLT